MKGIAALTLLVWTERSVDAAANAACSTKRIAPRHAGAYAGVKLDDVELPFGFGGLQLFDLSEWNGSAGDPRVADMATALKGAAGGAKARAHRRCRRCRTSRRKTQYRPDHRDHWRRC
jgi:hypothetical protein